MKHYLSLLIFSLLTTASVLSSGCKKSPDSLPAPPPVNTPPPVTGPNVTVTTIAGKVGDHGNGEDGNGIEARFWNPTKMVFDPRNNTLYVADGTVIRSIDQQNNV